MNPLYAIDFYKASHFEQYPPDTEQVWSNWTPRYTHREASDGVVFFGLQAFLKNLHNAIVCDTLTADIETDAYMKFLQKTLPNPNPKVDHIHALVDYFNSHACQLPLDIWALPEGSLVPYGVPCLVITNTDPRFFWLPNYLETMMSNQLWLPSTSATTAREYRKIGLKWARAYGVKDESYVDYQFHDFSFRGLAGLEAAEQSGLGHLLSFNGTDTAPALLAAARYYGRPIGPASIPATEHSVMCAGGEDGEFETFKRLITEVYPSGPVSIVSDTWDLWRVLMDYIPRLSETILNRRGGPLVIRPDSGDPVKIVCGDTDSASYVERDGVLRLLASALGVNSDGMINNGRVIYGDSITPKRADEILRRTVQELRLSPANVILGVGSFTYQYVTRDTDGWAMKATAVKRAGKVVPIFKKPVTDSGGKFSLSGIPLVYDVSHFHGGNAKPIYEVHTTVNPDMLAECAFEQVLDNGRLVKAESWETIQRRVREGL